MFLASCCKHKIATSRCGKPFPVVLGRCRDRFFRSSYLGITEVESKKDQISRPQARNCSYYEHPNNTKNMGKKTARGPAYPTNTDCYREHNTQSFRPILCFEVKISTLDLFTMALRSGKKRPIDRMRVGRFVLFVVRCDEGDKW